MVNAFATFQSDKRYRELYMPLKNFTTSRQASLEKKNGEDAVTQINDDKKISAVTEATISPL